MVGSERRARLAGAGDDEAGWWWWQEREERKGSYMVWLGVLSTETGSRPQKVSAPHAKAICGRVFLVSNPRNVIPPQRGATPSHASMPTGLPAAALCPALRLHIGARPPARQPAYPAGARAAGRTFLNFLAHFSLLGNSRARHVMQKL